MPLRTASIAVALLAGLAAALPLAAEPFLVRDLAPGSVGHGAEASSLTLRSPDGILYFASSDPTHGTELWRSDGTVAGTRRVTDLCPGPCSSDPGPIAFFRGDVYFGADDGFSGRELWRSDGSPGSERRVRDLCPGPCHGGPFDLTEVGGKLVFTAASSADGSRHLWRTTGSRRSTVEIARIPYNFGFSLGLQRMGDLALYIISRPRGGELWRTDGTPAGTRPLRLLPGWLPSGSLPVVAGGFAFVFTSHALWRSDGTEAGTVRLKGLDELVPQSRYTAAAAGDGTLYAVLVGDGNRQVLVRSDGTPEGTVVAADLSLAPHGRPFEYVTSLVSTPAGLFFTVGELSSATSLWRTRGTAGTTEEVFFDQGASLSLVTPFGGGAVFVVQRQSEEPSEIWSTDGTAAGTRLVAPFPALFGPYELVSTGDRAFFNPGGGGIWRTDGTAAGTLSLREAEGPASGGPLTQAELGGRLVFSAQTAEGEAPFFQPLVPLFRSDGTPAGTQMLSEEASGASDFLQVGDRLFFTRRSAADGLWRTDGTAAGTAAAVDEAYQAQPVAALGGRLLFAGAHRLPSSGLFDLNVELWRTQEEGIAKVKEINPYGKEGRHHTCGPASSLPGPGVTVEGFTVFAAEDGLAGRELWRSDGTRTGTRLVRDIDPRRQPELIAPDCDERDTPLSSNPEGFVRFRGGALFTAEDGASGRELWWTDGTAAGTRRVVDLLPGPRSAAPRELTVLGDRAYFLAPRDGGGDALWRTDGTAEGTVRVHGLTLGGSPSWARSLTAAGGRLFFVVYNERTGPELWTSDGGIGTRMVVDLRPGARGSYPQSLTASGNVLVFAADDGETGLEPWRSDGTAGGTFRLGDLHPGRDSSAPGPFTRAGENVFTGADDGLHGRELWAIPLADVLP